MKLIMCVAGFVEALIVSQFTQETFLEVFEQTTHGNLISQHTHPPPSPTNRYTTVHSKVVPKQ